MQKIVTVMTLVFLAVGIALAAETAVKEDKTSVQVVGVSSKKEINADDHITPAAKAEAVKQESVQSEQFDEDSMDEENACETVKSPSGAEQKKTENSLLNPDLEKYYQTDSFVAPVDWEPDGYITGDKDKRLLISAGDTVFVNLGLDRVKPGSICMVYRIVGKVKDRQTRDLVGYEARRVARVKILGAGEKSATARVLVSYEPLEIGDSVRVLADTKENTKE